MLNNMLNNVCGYNLGEGLRKLRCFLYYHGHEIQTERWQGKEDPPVFIEVLHGSMFAPMANTVQLASESCDATQPWADMHFDERVGGVPCNPPPSHKFWLKDTDKYLADEKAFSHSYPERMWCDREHQGIRNQWGNLQDAVSLLKKEPYTRQCYIPIWFPEDLRMANEGQRVPCTFGWHFMLRDRYLHCSYHMRSCDAVRHLHNDLYLANRLCLWMIDEAELDAVPGYIHFSSTSLHCFKNDKYILGRLIGKK